MNRRESETEKLDEKEKKRKAGPEKPRIKKINGSPGCVTSVGRERARVTRLVETSSLSLSLPRSLSFPSSAPLLSPSWHPSSFPQSISLPLSIFLYYTTTSFLSLSLSYFPDFHPRFRNS